jgi:hypothetical protein
MEDHRGGGFERRVIRQVDQPDARPEERERACGSVEGADEVGMGLGVLGEPVPGEADR